MANNPLNLVLRFILELIALYAIGYWGWTQHTGIWQFILAILLPLAAAAIWGTFRVPDDPGKAPVQIPGIARLILETLTFSSAVWCFFAAGQTSIAIMFGAVIVFHYAISYDRIIWLLTQK